MSIREQKKADKLARIKAAAEDLFADKGFDSTTTREIAERAGIGTGTLFTYVENKEELVILIWDEHVQDVLDERMCSLPEGPLTDRFLHICEGLFAFYGQSIELGSIYLQQVLFAQGSAKKRVDERNTGFMALLIGLIQTAQARGEVRADLPLFEGAFILFSTYCMGLMSRLHGEAPDLETATELVRRMLDIQMQGFAPES